MIYLKVSIFAFFLKTTPMKYLATAFVLACIVLFNSLPSCQLAEGTGRAHFMIDSFYHCFDRGEYEHIADYIIDPDLVDGPDRQVWIDALADMQVMGPCSERSKGFGFNTRISSGITTVELKFTSVFSGGTSADEFEMQDSGNGFKLRYFHWEFTPTEKE